MGERITWQNPNFRIIDGGQENVTNNDIRVAVEARIRFIDAVMARIEESTPLEIIDGGNQLNVQSKNTPEIVNFKRKGELNE